MFNRSPPPNSHPWPVIHCESVIQRRELAGEIVEGTTRSPQAGYQIDLAGTPAPLVPDAAQRVPQRLETLLRRARVEPIPGIRRSPGHVEPRFSSLFSDLIV
jgi:hypothetical protein